jgi:enoyl-CoA hydratase/carnithine racemase
MNAVVSKIGVESLACGEALVSDEAASGRLDLLGELTSLKIHRLDHLDTLLVSKLTSGFDRTCVDGLNGLLSEISEGRLPSLKYLVFDFGHRDRGPAPAAEGFDDLASANARLILDAPVISIAWARSHLSGSDLDFALSCSMMVADHSASFSFDADLDTAIGVYGALAQKLGFVKAERLLEAGAELGAEQMQELGLIKHIVENEEGIEGAESYVRQCGRRYNASYSMFRAQRITAPPVRRHSVAAAASRRG